MQKTEQSDTSWEIRKKGNHSLYHRIIQNLAGGLKTTTHKNGVKIFVMDSTEKVQNIELLFSCFPKYKARFFHQIMKIKNIFI